MPHALPPTDVRPTLLIVDDSPENLTVLGELLQDSYTVRAANSGARALELAALQPQPDLILLDIMMPDMDGFQVLARLRADALTQDLPVIFVTAMSADADEEHGLALGAADYITKPIRTGGGTGAGTQPAGTATGASTAQAAERFSGAGNQSSHA